MTITLRSNLSRPLTVSEADGNIIDLDSRVTTTTTQITSITPIIGDSVAAPTTNLTSAVGSAGALTGSYYYATAYLTATGVTAPWPGTATVVSPVAQRVNLTNIPISPSPLCIGRRIYRTKAASVDPKDYFFVVDILDNTTRTYTDNATDGSLGAAPSWAATNRGYVIESGAPVSTFSDQAVSLGTQSFANKAGYASVAIGYRSQASIEGGKRNSSLGIYTLENLTSGFQNNAFGAHAGNFLTTQQGNNFFGTYCGFYAGTGVGAATNNTAIGEGALQGVNGTGIGSSNVAVGYRALYQINTADNCIGIGPAAGQFANASRQLFIDPAGTLRANIAAHQNVGLIYGKAESTAAAQVLHLNAQVRIGAGDVPTVAGLPAAASGFRGYRGFVTDASVAYTSANIGTTVAGGGANVVPVFCTGSAWVIG